MSGGMQVRRVETPTGSHIEPPCDQTWSREEKLRWHAAVASVDALVTVSVSRADYRTKTLGVWRPTPGEWFNVHVGMTSVAGPMDFDHAWSYISGVSAGARARVFDE